VHNEKLQKSAASVFSDQLSCVPHAFPMKQRPKMSCSLTLSVTVVVVVVIIIIIIVMIHLHSRQLNIWYCHTNSLSYSYALISGTLNPNIAIDGWGSLIFNAHFCACCYHPFYVLHFKAKNFK